MTVAFSCDHQRDNLVTPSRVFFRVIFPSIPRTIIFLWLIFSTKSRILYFWGNYSAWVACISLLYQRYIFRYFWTVNSVQTIVNKYRLHSIKSTLQISYYVTQCHLFSQTSIHIRSEKVYIKTPRTVLYTVALNFSSNW